MDEERDFDEVSIIIEDEFDYAVNAEEEELDGEPEIDPNKIVVMFRMNSGREYTLIVDEADFVLRALVLKIKNPTEEIPSELNPTTQDGWIIIRDVERYSALLPD